MNAELLALAEIFTIQKFMSPSSHNQHFYEDLWIFYNPCHATNYHAQS